jgi:predicted transcriptional regulator of viral defense system
MTTTTKTKSYEKAIRVFRGHGGLLSSTEAMRAGIHPRDLYAMRDAKLLNQLSRGLYRLSNIPPLENPDFVTVARRVPEGVFCLISALSFHELTTQIPHENYVALKMGSRTPKLDYPPIRTFHFSGKAFTEGIETRKVDGVPFRIYSPEKTLADCFKCRHVVGLDTALEALRNYWRSKWKKTDELTRFSKICRVDKVMTPYLEAIQGA